MIFWTKLECVKGTTANKIAKVVSPWNQWNLAVKNSSPKVQSRKLTDFAILFTVRMKMKLWPENTGQQKSARAFLLSASMENENFPFSILADNRKALALFVVQYFLVIIYCFLDWLFWMRLGHNIQQNSTKRDQYWSFWCQGWSNHHEQEFLGGNRAGEANEVAEAAEVSQALKIASEDFRVIQVLEFYDLKANFIVLTDSWKSHSILATFLLKAGEASLSHCFENWLMKLKWPHLGNTQMPSS